MLRSKPLYKLGKVTDQKIQAFNDDGINHSNNIREESSSIPISTT